MSDRSPMPAPGAVCPPGAGALPGSSGTPGVFVVRAVPGLLASPPSGVPAWVTAPRRATEGAVRVTGPVLAAHGPGSVPDADRRALPAGAAAAPVSPVPPDAGPPRSRGPRIAEGATR